MPKNSAYESTDILKRMKIDHSNSYQNKAGVTILMLDKIGFKIKTTIRDKEGHYIMTYGSIQEENIANVNIYACNRKTTQYKWQMPTDIKGETGSYTKIMENLNTRLP